MSKNYFMWNNDSMEYKNLLINLAILF